MLPGFEHLVALVMVASTAVACVGLAEVLDAPRGSLEPARRTTLVRAGGAVLVFGGAVLLGDVVVEHAGAALRAAEVHASAPRLLVAYALRLLGV